MKLIPLIIVLTMTINISSAAQTIAGGWTLEAIVTDRHQRYDLVVPVTLSISGDGLISGNGGCNSYTGRYSFSSKPRSFRSAVKIGVTDIRATERDCDNGGVAESAFFESLRNAVSIRVRNGKLLIAGKAKGNLLTFKRGAASVKTRATS